MEMTKGDILKSYKEAKDKREQVRILADLNQTTQREIATILREQGVDGRAFQWLDPSRKKKKENSPTAKHQAPEKVLTPPRVRPRIAHDFARMTELFKAIHEDVIADKVPPEEWVSEFDELWLKYIDTRKERACDNG